METIVIVVICLVVGLGGYFITKHPDGPVEEAAERVIKSETGLDIDITPGSKEVD